MRQKIQKIVLALAGLTLLGLAIFALVVPRINPPAEFSAAFDWKSFSEPAKAISGSPTFVEVTAYQVPDNSYDYRYWSNSYVSSAVPLSYKPSDGIALVKELRSVDFAQGPVSLSLKGVSAHIDPTSLHLADVSGATTVLEQNYDYDLVSAEKLLDKYVDSQISISKGNDTATGILISPNGPILQTSNGIKVFSAYDALSFPTIPEGFVTKPTITWLLNSNNAGKRDIQVSYLTSGINWNADYVAVANSGDSALSLQAWVSLRNDAGVTFKDAKLKLVAGDINLVQRNGYPSPTAMYDMAYGASQKQFSEQAFFEYHLYTLERPTTISSGQVKQIEMASAGGVGAKKEYVFDSGSQSYYSSSRSSGKVSVKLSFKNSEANGLGIPLPKGKVRVYKADADGQLEFVGEDLIDHTPKDETVRLTLGNAFDIVGERAQTDTQRIGNCANRYSYDIALRNHKEEDVTVKVVEHSYGEWEIIKESAEHDKESSTQFSWSVPVKADGEATLTYTIENRWC